MFVYYYISHLRLSNSSLIYLSNLSYLHYLTLNIDLKFKLISELLVFEKKERSTWYLKKRREEDSESWADVRTMSNSDDYSNRRNQLRR